MASIFLIQTEKNFLFELLPPMRFNDANILLVTLIFTEKNTLIFLGYTHEKLRICTPQLKFGTNFMPHVEKKIYLAYVEQRMNLCF